MAAARHNFQVALGDGQTAERLATFLNRVTRMIDSVTKRATPQSR
jgi:hypothetical protein